MDDKKTELEKTNITQHDLRQLKLRLDRLARDRLKETSDRLSLESNALRPPQSPE